MKEQERISEEQLNAFVDNELDAADWTQLIEGIRRDDTLAERVCELRQLKDMVQMSYREPPQRPRVPGLKARSGSKARTALAAAVVLAVGAAGGWLSFAHLQGGQGGTFAQVVSLDADRQDPRRIVVHVASADGDRLDSALGEAEALLAAFRAKAQRVKLEVVANAEGIDLLRTDASPYVQRIHRLASQYDNISFLACSRAIEKLRLKGIEVHLVPEARVIPGALEQIVTRLQEGWVYIRV